MNRTQDHCDVTTEPTAEPSSEERLACGRITYALLVTILVATVFICVLGESSAVTDPYARSFICVFSAMAMVGLHWLRFQSIGYKSPGMRSLSALIPGMLIPLFVVCVIFPEGYASSKKIDMTGKAMVILFVTASVAAAGLAIVSWL